MPMTSHFYSVTFYYIDCHCIESVSCEFSSNLCDPAMPPKTKRARQSIEAATKGREALKKARTDLETESGGTTESG